MTLDKWFSSNASEVLIIKGNYENFLKSICDFQKTGEFLWGFKREADLKAMIKCSDCPVVFHVNNYGFSMIAKVKKQTTPSGPYWPVELMENKVIYSYRILLEPVKISKCFIEHNLCVSRQTPSKECFVKAGKVQKYLKEKCGISDKEATIPLGTNVNIVRRECKAEKILEYLEQKLVPLGVEQTSPSYALKNLIERVKHGEEEGLKLSELVLLPHLSSGKNVLLVGPPGSGKTRLVKKLLEKLNIKHDVKTGNPEWTPFDTLGGPVLTTSGKGFVKGFVLKAVEESVEAVKKGELFWLIIDEINRANVDLAFGEFFTLLDPVYREDTSLTIPGLEEHSKIHVPFSFRVLATMNSYDRALLFKLGYALTRRFAIVNYTYLEQLPSYYREWYLKHSHEVAEKLMKAGREGGGLEAGLDFNVIKEELTLCRKDVPQDCITPLDFRNEVLNLGDRWRSGIYTLQTLSGVVELEKVVAHLVGKINAELSRFGDCEICPVEVTPGVVADALKYIAVGVYAYNKGLVKQFLEPQEGAGQEPAGYALLLLDSAFSAYIIPQLDILADYASREKLQSGVAKASPEKGGASATGVLKKIGEMLREHGLYYSSGLVEKLSKGYHVF